MAFGPCCGAMAPNPTLPQPRDSADTTCSFLNFFNPHISAIVNGCLIGMHRKVTYDTYGSVAQNLDPNPQSSPPSPCLSPGAPLGHRWRVLDIGTGSRAPPGAANQPQPTYKGQRSPERGIVACTTFTKMNSFVSPSISFVKQKAKTTVSRIFLLRICH